MFELRWPTWPKGADSWSMGATHVLGSQAC